MEDEYFGTKLEPSEFHVILGEHNVRNGCILKLCIFIDNNTGLLYLNCNLNLS